MDEAEPEGAKSAIRSRVLTLFGTRPEIIKLAPVVRALEARPGRFETRNATSGQHTGLLAPFVRELGLRLDIDLQVARRDQTPLQVCHRVLESLGPVLAAERPDALLVQGDTTTAMSGALAGFYQGVPVGHVEAGLRSGDVASPFPEEMNRRLITQLASYHFAATERNRETLLREGVSPDRIAVTGNPVVDALGWALENTRASGALQGLLQRIQEKRIVVLTTHRRESFGQVMGARLSVLRRFVERHPDTALVFPVHPNPEVRASAQAKLASAERVHLIDPLEYIDFVHLLGAAWLVVSDSGGVQEEAPSLGKPVLVIRENTERVEALEAGVARLAGESAERLEALLEQSYADPSWFPSARSDNPFGRGDAGARIADALERLLPLRPRAEGRSAASRR